MPRPVSQIRIPVVAALVAALPPVLAAQAAGQAAPAPPGITLAAAIETAMRQNYDLLIAQTAVDSAAAERRIARALPNPVLAGTPNTPYQYSVTIPLDVTPQRFIRGRVASLGASAASFDRGDVRRQATLAVARAFFDALLADERRRILERRRDDVAKLLRADSARFWAGDVAERNLVRSEVELARADADVARAGLDVQTARTTLQGLMGIVHPDTALAAIGTLDYRRLEPGTDSLIASARLHRPDLLASAQRVEQSINARRAASALLIPTPVFSYARQYTAPFESGHFYSLGLGFELPSLNLYAGQRERAAAGAESARLAVRRAEGQMERDVASGLAGFRIQRALVERYQSGLVSKIDAGVAAAEYAYSRGAGSLLEVLDAVQAEEQFRIEYVTALHDYWVSVYGLNAAVGTDVFGLAT